MSIEWLPIDRVPGQTMVLVGHEAFRGWFEIAERSALGEWHKALTQTPLKRTPTHFAYIEPPPLTNFFPAPEQRQ